MTRESRSTLFSSEEGGEIVKNKHLLQLAFKLSCFTCKQNSVFPMQKLYTCIKPILENYTKIGGKKTTIMHYMQN